MLDAWFKPTPQNAVSAIQRNEAEQAEVDSASSELALYHYDSCMFCARVRQAIAQLKLNIELRDVMRERSYYQELALNGGRTTVPCLRIGKTDAANDTWMYESADIIRYLAERFGAPAA